MPAPQTPSATLPWEAIADRQPVSLRIAAATARDIVEGRRPGGTLITEAELAAAHGASRTPAREATVLLEGWGLVQLLPKKGALVTTVTPAERRDLLDLRTMFETQAVRRLQSRPGELAALGRRLDAELDRQRAALADDDRLGFAASDHGFHAALIAAGGNAVVDQLMATLAPRFARLTHLAAGERPDQLQVWLDGHTRLAGLAAAGDPDAFALAVAQHVSDGHGQQLAHDGSPPARG